MDDVLNWLLQSSVIALATWTTLRILDTRRARARYAVLWVALVSILLLPAVPFVTAAVWPAAAPAVIPASRHSLVELPSGWWVSSTVVIGVWLAWSCASAARLALAAVGLRRARRACRPFPADAEARLAGWTTVRARGRRTRLMLSNDVTSAAVLGWGSPIVAVAPAVFDHLAGEDLDRVVVHEWAHVQRRDDLAHLVQVVVRIAAGWQPIVWWLDRQLCREREAACDDMAVAVTGSARHYAESLTRLASLPRPHLRSLPTLAALSSSNLRWRLVRILTRTTATPSRPRRAAAICAGVALCGVALMVGGQRFIEVEMPAAAGAVSASSHASAFDAGRPVHVDGTPSQPVRTTTLARAERRRTIARATSPAMASAPARLEVGAAAVPTRSVADVAARPLADAAPVDSTSPPLPVVRVPAHTAGVVERPASTLGANASVIEAKPLTPWAAAADAGAGVGQTSQKAALAAAGFFTRFGKRIAGSF